MADFVDPSDPFPPPTAPSPNFIPFAPLSATSPAGTPSCLSYRSYEDQSEVGIIDSWTCSSCGHKNEIGCGFCRNEACEIEPTRVRPVPANWIGGYFQHTDEQFQGKGKGKDRARPYTSASRASHSDFRLRQSREAEGTQYGSYVLSSPPASSTGITHSNWWEDDTHDDSWPANHWSDSQSWAGWNGWIDYR